MRIRISSGSSSGSACESGVLCETIVTHDRSRSHSVRRAPHMCQCVCAVCVCGMGRGCREGRIGGAGCSSTHACERHAYNPGRASKCYSNSTCVSCAHVVAMVIGVYQK